MYLIFLQSQQLISCKDLKVSCDLPHFLESADEPKHLVSQPTSLVYSQYPVSMISNCHHYYQSWVP